VKVFKKDTMCRFLKNGPSSDFENTRFRYYLYGQSLINWKNNWECIFQLKLLFDLSTVSYSIHVDENPKKWGVERSSNPAYIFGWDILRALQAKIDFLNFFWPEYSKFSIYFRRINRQVPLKKINFSLYTEKSSI
jgi:hypothetical protein